MKKVFPNILSGLLFIVLGILIIVSGDVPLRQFGTGWFAVNEKASLGTGILVIICGLYPLYFAVKNFISSCKR